MEALRGLENSLQHRYKGKFDPAATPEEQVVTPPADTPPPMSTPYAAPHPAAGMMTPTFLPMTKEDIVPRLMSNIAQGWVGATGWHLLDYSRSVDMFGPWR